MRQRILDVVQLWKRLTRVGFVNALLVADAFAMTLFLWDVVQVVRLGIDPRQILLRVGILDWTSGITGLVVWSLALPVSLAILRVEFGAKSRHHGTLAREVSHFGFTFHVVTSILLAVAVLLVPALHSFAGLRYSNGTFHYALYPLAMDLFAMACGGGLSLVWWFLTTVAFPTLLVFWTRKSDLADSLADFKERLVLADLRGELYPAGFSPIRSNFMAGVVSPGVASAVTKANAAIQNYRRSGIGSPEAKKSLVANVSDCRRLVRDMLLDPSESAHSPKHIAFLPSTSRALEAALAVSNATHIILSPFEHPSERELAFWWRRTLGLDVVEIARREEWASVSSTEAVDEVILAIDERLGRLGDGARPVIVVSDVCWATGSRVPVRRMITELKGMSRHKLTVIVDGAHAVGNGSYVRYLDVADHYVFSGHKWLCSAEPLGILLSKETVKNRPSIDAWYGSLNDDELQWPVATVSPSALIHFSRALEAIAKVGFPKLWERSAMFKARLLRRLESGNSVRWLGSECSAESSSFIMALCPRAGYKWRQPDVPRLQQALDSERIATTVLDKAVCGRTAVRLTLPYCLSVRDVDHAADVLNHMSKKR